MGKKQNKKKAIRLLIVYKKSGDSKLDVSPTTQ
jgi:hypothetical protein